MNKIPPSPKFIIFLILFSLVFSPGKISHAGLEGQLSLFPDTSSFMDKEKIIINVIASTPSTAINTFQIKLSYDSEIIAFDKTVDSNPLCDFYHSEDIFNNFLVITCFSPQVITPSATTLLSLEFTKIQTGWAKLDITESQLLAHDGFGTNIFLPGEIHNLFIAK